VKIEEDPEFFFLVWNSQLPSESEVKEKCPFDDMEDFDYKIIGPFSLPEN
jgi:hypothetical protein